MVRRPLRSRIRSALLSPELADSAHFDHKFLQDLVDAHASGDCDYRASVWSFMIFHSSLTQSAAAEASVRERVGPEALHSAA